MRFGSLAVLVAVASLNAGAGQFRAGAARTALTPASPVRLIGTPGQRCASTAGQLFARAVAVEDEAGARVVFLSAELLAIPRSVAERIAVTIMREHGLERGQIVISATGAHQTPFVHDLLTGRAPETSAAQEDIERYTTQVTETMSRLAGEALTGVRPVRVSLAQTSAGDASLPVLRFVDAGGGTLAVVFAWPFGGRPFEREAAQSGSCQVSGGESAAASAALEREFPGAVALPLRQCGASSGDAALGPTASGRSVTNAIVNGLSAPARRLDGRVKATLLETMLPFEPYSRRQFELEAESSDPVRARRGRRLLTAYDERRLHSAEPYPVQVVLIGRDFALVALSGDVPAGHARKIGAILHRRDVVVVEGANGGAYSVPSADASATAATGYVDSIVDSGFPAAFTGESEQRILDTVARAWKRLSK
jgi:hypothetical protein